MNEFKIIEILANPEYDQLLEKGKELGKLWTDQGFPIEVSLEMLQCSKEDKMSMLFGAQSWFIEHLRNSGGTDKAIERQRKANRLFFKKYV